MIIRKQADQSLPIFCGGVGWRGGRGGGDSRVCAAVKGIVFKLYSRLDRVWKSKVTGLGPLPKVQRKLVSQLAIRASFS